MDGEAKQVVNAAKQVGKDLKSGITPEEFGDLVTGFLKTGKMPKAALGFSDERIEATYGQAYRLYNTGKYEDASYIFRLLVFLDPAEPKFGLGLAACFHMMKDYKNAIQTYMILTFLDPNTPIPYFHASDCYIEMRNPASALLMLEMAVKRSGEQPEYQLLKERALLTIDKLKKELHIHDVSKK